MPVTTALPPTARPFARKKRRPRHNARRIYANAARSTPKKRRSGGASRLIWWAALASSVSPTRNVIGLSFIGLPRDDRRGNYAVIPKTEIFVAWGDDEESAISLLHECRHMILGSCPQTGRHVLKRTFLGDVGCLECEDQAWAGVARDVCLTRTQ